MKMHLLQDILKGLDELERHERRNAPAPTTAKPKPPFNLLGNIVKVSRETSVKGNPPGKTSDVITTMPKTYANYAQTRQPYEFDPETVAFLGVKRDSDHHHNKLRDLDMISRYDPGLAHKILTLS